MDKPKLRARTLGKRIAEAYKAQGWNRSQFHRALQAADPSLASLAYTSIRAWESGEKEPRVSTLRVIARITGYSLDELTAEPEDEMPGPGSESDETLSDEQIGELLDKLGATESIKAATIQELTAYPPKHGVTHFEVVRVHRIMTRSVEQYVPPHPENTEADAALAQMGLPGTVDQKNIRERHATLKKRAEADKALQAARKDAAKRKNG